MTIFKFPPEFSQLLNRRGLSFLHAKKYAQDYRSLSNQRKFLLLTDVIKPRVASACVRTLDRCLYEHLITINGKISADSISRMAKNYSELLGKTLHLRTAFFQRRTSGASRVAEEIGLLRMMRSETLARFAEAATGVKLAREVGCQVICYEHGDYVGPHTDHYPENDVLRDGYVDLHIMFTNAAVHHQWLVYEAGGHFSKVLNVNLHGAAIYRLPFWHYTTPLMGHLGREEKARRWVLLVTFALERCGKKTKRATFGSK